MVQRRQRERSLFEVLLPDGHKLWPDWLRKIDTLLEDEAVIEVVAQGLKARWPQSRRRGRPGTPAEVVIRMLILKHLFDWSYDDLEREVRANLVYRMFTRIDAGDVPDAKTILEIARALGSDVIEQLHRAVGIDVDKNLVHRVNGRTPLTFVSGHAMTFADLNHVRWVSHCRDLFQLQSRPDGGFESHRLCRARQDGDGRRRSRPSCCAVGGCSAPRPSDVPASGLESCAKSNICHVRDTWNFWGMRTVNVAN